MDPFAARVDELSSAPRETNDLSSLPSRGIACRPCASLGDGEIWERCAPSSGAGSTPSPSRVLVHLLIAARRHRIASRRL